MKRIFSALCCVGGLVATTAHAQEPSAVAGETACARLDAPYQTTATYVADASAGGRLWERYPTQAAMDLSDANNYCAELRLGGLAGWRVPTLAELQSILLKAGGLHAGIAGTCSPAIDQTAFPETPADYFWTAAGINVNFFDGRGHHVPASESAYVRCVHDP